jgi:WD40 repeat protein
VNDTALTSDGSTIATAAAGTINGEFTPAIFVWNAASGDLKFTLTNADPFPAIAFSPDGSLIAAASGTNLYFWSAADGQKITVIPTGSESILELAFAPNGPPSSPPARTERSRSGK